MNIWVIGRSYPDNKNNMMGSFELEQAKMLRKKCDKVHYICTQIKYKQPIKGHGYHTWEEDGVTIHAYSNLIMPRVCQLYVPAIRNFYWRRHLKRVCSESGLPDVIHVHFPAMVMIADVLTEYHNKGSRIFATEHWTKVLGKTLVAKEKAEFRKYNSLLSQMICVGSPLRDAVKELTGMDSVIVPNVVNGLFQPSIAQHDDFRFIAVGRLVKVKQFDKIIEAFSECFLGADDVSLTIVGDGPERESLESIIEEKHIADQVKMVGNQSRENTAEIVSNSDNLICYSRFETFGVPIIEAWSCGLTTTTTTTAAAVIDNFDERLGVEVSFEDYQGLKKALKYIYENRTKYNKEFIVNYAREHFSEDCVSERLLEIYCKENEPD